VQNVVEVMQKIESEDTGESRRAMEQFVDMWTKAESGHVRPFSVAILMYDCPRPVLTCKTCSVHRHSGAICFTTTLRVFVMP
jgi:hypothetical protein